MAIWPLMGNFVLFQITGLCIAHAFICLTFKGSHGKIAMFGNLVAVFPKRKGHHLPKIALPQKKEEENKQNRRNKNTTAQHKNEMTRTSPPKTSFEGLWILRKNHRSGTTPATCRAGSPSGCTTAGPTWRRQAGVKPGGGGGFLSDNSKRFYLVWLQSHPGELSLLKLFSWFGGSFH